MPLLDHFHPPASRYPWESFHMRWASAIADLLDRALPRNYFATVHTHLGPDVSADVTEVERPGPAGEGTGNGAAGGGVAVQPYTVPAATASMPAVFPDDLEVQVQDEREDGRVVAVIELVSPRNKDRPKARGGFAGKCAAYLQRGIGLIVVDIVTSRGGNLHNDLVRLFGLAQAGPFLMPEEAALYAVAYRPVRRGEASLIDLWAAPLALGSPLPVLPLALRGAAPVPLDLEGPYHDLCQRIRLP
jgi:hypothetical protein